MTEGKIFAGRPYAASRLFMKLALAVAVGALSLVSFAEGLFNVAQTSLGATAVTTGAPFNKDWPALKAIPKEDPRNMRGGALFGAPMEGRLPRHDVREEGRDRSRRQGREDGRA